MAGSSPNEQPEPETLVERALGPLTWVVAVFALLIVIALFLFFIFGFFGSDDEVLGVLAAAPA